MQAVHFSRRSLIQGAAASLALGAMPAVAKQPDQFTPFSFHAPDDVLSDLKRRLETVRFPEPATEPGFAQGPPIEKLQALTAY